MESWKQSDPIERFLQLPSERQEKLLCWIKENLMPTKAINLRHSSYGLKHLVRFTDGSDAFFTNGEFKGAMLQGGFSVKDAEALNWQFNISERSPALQSTKGARSKR